MLINSAHIMEYLLLSVGVRPVNKEKIPPARRSQSDKIKKELSQRAKLNATNSIGIFGFSFLFFALRLSMNVFWGQS